MSSFRPRLARFARTGVLLCLMAGSGAASVAHGASEERTLKQMVALNQRALSAHAVGRPWTARKLLLDALARGKAAGLQSHVMSARTLIHLGIVAIGGLERRDEGLTFFAEGLRIHPTIKLTPKLATPALEADFEQARGIALKDPAGESAAPAVSQPSPPPPASSTPKPKEVTEPPAVARNIFANGEEPDVPVTIPQPLYCPTPFEGPPDEDVNLLCLTQPQITVSRVVAYYRAASDTYVAIPMIRSKKGWYSAVIPSNHVIGRSLQFYFEAHRNGKDVPVQNGNDESPNTIVLKEGALPVGVGALAALHAIAVSGRLGAAEQSPIELRESADAEAERKAQVRRRPAGNLFVGLGLGTGWGWHGKRPLEAHRGRMITPGVSSDGVGHIAPELGWQVTEDLALSLQSRHQYLPTSGSGDAEATGSPPITAHAIIARMQYALAAFGDMQVLGTAALGGGSALRLKVEPDREIGVVTSDTVVIGPLVASVGVGAAYNISSRWLVLAEARALGAGWNPGLLAELNASVQIAF